MTIYPVEYPLSPLRLVRPITDSVFCAHISIQPVQPLSAVTVGYQIMILIRTKYSYVYRGQHAQYNIIYVSIIY